MSMEVSEGEDGDGVQHRQQISGLFLSVREHPAVISRL